MSTDLQVSHLRTLVAIAEEESFEAAARRVGRSQSAVSQQMQKLVEVVGSPLFEQRGRQRVLTQAGLTLADYGRDIISMSRYALSATNASSDRGLIRLGIPHELADYLMPTVLSQFAQQRPDITINLHIGRSPALLDLLRERRIDLAVAMRQSTIYEGARVLSLPTVWIAGQHYQHDPTRPVPLIMTDEPSVFRRIALTALDLAGVHYFERVVSSSLAGIQTAVRAGVGVTVRTETSFIGDTRTLGEQDGLPPLQSVHYFSYRTMKEPPAHIHDMLRLIEASAQRLQQAKV